MQRDVIGWRGVGRGGQGRAVQEVVTQRALHHDCILPVLAYFEDRDALYMVVPFLNGGSVSDIIRNRHPQVPRLPLPGVRTPGCTPASRPLSTTGKRPIDLFR